MPRAAVWAAPSVRQEQPPRGPRFLRYPARMTMLADLSDDACVQVIHVDPPLADAKGLLHSIDKLFTQFAREGRVAAWAVEMAAAGALIVIAYSPGAQGGPLTGCAKDTLTKLLLACEQHSGSRLIGAPTIALLIGEGTAFCDRAGLRQRLSDGSVSASTPVHNVRASHLGEWRRRPRLPLGESWLASLVDAKRSG